MNCCMNKMRLSNKQYLNLFQVKNKSSMLEFSNTTTVKLPNKQHTNTNNASKFDQQLTVGHGISSSKAVNNKQNILNINTQGSSLMLESKSPEDDIEHKLRMDRLRSVIKSMSEEQQQLTESLRQQRLRRQLKLQSETRIKQQICNQIDKIQQLTSRIPKRKL